MSRPRAYALGACIAALAAAALAPVDAAATGIRSPTANTLAAAAVPQLGTATSPAQSGFGKVRPRKVFLGGDPTGLVERVQWSGWGGAQAQGTGVAEYVWPGTTVAANGLDSRARVVAFHLGTCRGRRSYNAIEWYFPEYGQVFNPRAYIDTCTGDPVGGPHVHPCPNVALQDGTGTAVYIEVAAISCRAASALIAQAPVAQYLTSKGGRFMQSGFRCGTEGGRGGSASFGCQKGALEFSYIIEPATSSNGRRELLPDRRTGALNSSQIV